MTRREFITLFGSAAGCAALPLVARAQQAAPIVGFLRSTSLADGAPLVAAFRQSLAQGGFVEGRNVAIELRSAENQIDRLPALVADLIGRRSAVIVGNAPAAAAAKAATKTVPIVFVYGGDPVRDGFVTSMNRPGGNVTGVVFFGATLGAKRLDVLRQFVPKATTIAVLVNRNSPKSEAERRELEAAAQAFGQLIVVEVSSDRDVEAAFPAFMQRGAAALLVGPGAFLFSQKERIVALAARHALPTSYVWREAVVAGGLMSYGTSITDAYRQAGLYAGRILKGEKPADLPVIRSTKFEFVINLRTAKTLGLEFHPQLLATAEEVIELKRREFIGLLGGAAASLPFAARAQQSVPVIGFLDSGSRGGMTEYLAAFHRGLSEIGYAADKNVAIEYRWAEGQLDRLPNLAAELVQRPVSVITATRGPAPCLAARAATSTIPIVFQTGSDPVADGLVASLSRPGGNATGATRLTTDVISKRLGVMSELTLKMTSIAVLRNPIGPQAAGQLRETQQAAQARGLSLHVFNASTDHEMESAFTAIAQKKPDALTVATNPLFIDQRERLAAFAIRNSIPTIFGERESVTAGGLMSYAASLADSFRQVGVYVGRILKGEKPFDLPVLQPTKFDLIVNLKTAKTLGLAIPDRLMALADEVIE